jgi:hypothetical protein
MKKFLALFLAFVTLLLLVQAAASLRWRIEHDSPLLLYMAALIGRFGYVPYRDFFDINMPGAYWINLLVGQLAGWNDLGYRMVDLAILATIMACTYLWMRSFNRLAGWASAVVFGYLYLMWGPATALQREYLLLLPVSLGLAASSARGWPPWMRSAALGAGFGCAALIKPQAALGLLPFLFMLPELIAGRFVDGIRKHDKLEKSGYTQNEEAYPEEENLGYAQHTATSRRSPANRSSPGARLKLLLPLLLGFCVPFAIAVIYLWKTGALRPFLDMAINYWPLFNQLNGGQVSMSGLERLRYLLDRLLSLRDYPIWLAPALLGLYNSQYLCPLDEAQRRKARLIFWLAVCYALYTLAGGVFWAYHWIPFGYFTVQLASLCLLELPPSPQKLRQHFAAWALVFVILVALNLPYFDQRLEYTLSARLERVDRIAAFLEAHLQPGERVQPLDWTGGGAVQAMLMAGAQPATRFINDFHFYHHLSSPYIQGLRRELVQALKADPPRYIISYTAGDKPWPTGEDTSHEFNSLRRFIEANYRVVMEEEGLTIFELKK